MNFDEVMGQSSPTNCTVYCGGIINGLTGEQRTLAVTLAYDLTGNARKFKTSLPCKINCIRRMTIQDFSAADATML